MNSPVDYEDDEPITLAEACDRFFKGRLKPSALRSEAARGNLEIMQIARKDFVTKRAIEEMKQRCLRKRSPPDSNSDPKPAKDENTSTGSSETAKAMSAQDALRMKLQQRKQNSANTSGRSTSRSAEVVQLKSR